MVYTVRYNVSKGGKKYVCLVDESGRVVSVDRKVVDAIVGVYSYDADCHFGRAINELYNGSLEINITVEGA